MLLYKTIILQLVCVAHQSAGSEGVAGRTHAIRLMIELVAQVFECAIAELLEDVLK